MTKIRILRLRLFFLWLAISIRVNFYGYSHAYTCWHSKKFKILWESNIRFRNELKRIALDKLEYSPSLFNVTIFPDDIPYVTARNQRVELYLYIALKLPAKELKQLL